jgi:hypothetical protein
MPPKKKSQAELLELLSEPPFNQRRSVPPDAVVTRSRPETWWRSDSPRGVPDPEAEAREEEWMKTYREEKEPEAAELQGVPKNGVFSWRKRPEYKSVYQVGFCPATQAAVNGSGTVSGYSGFIPGKYAGGSLGCTYSAASIEAENHLKRTAQAVRFGVVDAATYYGSQNTTTEH